MSKSKILMDKVAKLIEQGMVTSKDLGDEIKNILKFKQDEIINKLNLITENFEKYSNMSINSRKICEKKFDEKIILEKFRKIIEQEF